VFDPDTARASCARSRGGERSEPLPAASFLLDRRGTKICVAAVTIWGRPLIPAALGSRPFDGEAAGERRSVLRREGVLEPLLARTAPASGLSPHTTRAGTAAASRSDEQPHLLPGKRRARADRLGEERLYVTELIGSA